jgi:hypothetical protein
MQRLTCGCACRLRAAPGKGGFAAAGNPADLRGRTDLARRALARLALRGLPILVPAQTGSGNRIRGAREGAGETWKKQTWKS